MKRLVLSLVGKVIDNLPGQRLGPYLPVPYFFAFGAGLEWFMINVNINGVNFYEVIRKKNREIYEEQQKRLQFEERFNKQLQSSVTKT